MMTAYYTKEKLSHKRTKKAIFEFFSNHFGEFIDKYTEWFLLYEPPFISPLALN